MYIKVFDNVISEDELIVLNNLFPTLQYRYELDFEAEDKPLSGFSGELPENITTTLHNKVSSIVTTEDYSIDRSYVNLIHNTDLFNFHVDYEGNGDARTALFYSNLYYDSKDYGETIFHDGEESKVVFPSPGRMIWFDGKLSHSARSFNRLRSDPRFTIAIKYIKNV